MIRLANKELSHPLSAVLQTLQQRIDALLNHEERVALAKALWETKGDATGKRAFEQIRAELKELCVHSGICNYCEHNEANDIEHIKPKSFFPENTFDWTNYLLACKQCNTAYKLDKCLVIDEHDELQRIPRGSVPDKNATVGFINPRIEDPSIFLILNCGSFKFELMPHLSKRDAGRAVGTLEVLRLNNRDTLIVSRRSTANHLYDKMDRLRSIMATTTKDELQDLLNPYDDRINWEQNLDTIKQHIMSGTARYIALYHHPSVWYAIKKIQRYTDPKWQRLFEAIPQAADW